MLGEDGRRDRRILLVIDGRVREGRFRIPRESSHRICSEGVNDVVLGS